MKKYLIFVLAPIIFSCSVKITNPEEMANSLFSCMKNNDSKIFLELFATEKDYTEWIDKQNLKPEQKKETYNQFEFLKQQGLFNEDTLLNKLNYLIQYPMILYPDFWHVAKINEYDGTEPELNNRGIEEADVYLSITYRDKIFIFRTGEMYKPGKKWIITSFPSWLVTDN